MHLVAATGLLPATAQHMVTCSAEECRAANAPNPSRTLPLIPVDRGRGLKPGPFRTARARLGGTRQCPARKAGRP